MKQKTTLNPTKLKKKKEAHIQYCGLYIVFVKMVTHVIKHISNLQRDQI